MMKPAWPERIVCGQAEHASPNAGKTGLSESKT
jgi:hypothetical protein